MEISANKKLNTNARLPLQQLFITVSKDNCKRECSVLNTFCLMFNPDYFSCIKG